MIGMRNLEFGMRNFHPLCLRLTDWLNDIPHSSFLIPNSTSVEV